MSSFRVACPVVLADDTVKGHGDANGYSVGGALSHASRCDVMADRIGRPDVFVGRKTRGPQSESDFMAAVAAKAESLGIGAAAEPLYDAATGKRIR